MTLGIPRCFEPVSPLDPWVETTHSTIATAVALAVARPFLPGEEAWGLRLACHGWQSSDGVESPHRIKFTSKVYAHGSIQRC